MRLSWLRGAVAVSALVFAADRAAARASDSTVRLLEWNVSDSAWIIHATETRAVLRHADPDVLVLVEVAAPMREADVRRMLSGIRGPSDTSWSIAMVGGNGLEHEVIASRAPVRAVPAFTSMPYPDTGALAARIALADTAKPAARETVRASGATVTVLGRSLLVVAVHFACCGTPFTVQEFRRQLGAAVVRDRVRGVLARSPAQGVIIAGDMNLVGGRAALDTVLTTLASSPLGPMLRADAFQPDGWTDWTWDGRGSPFNGGRLDNVTYSSGTLRVVRARVWDTEFMAPDTLAAHGLTASTSKTINRHRPVVVDLQFIR